MPQYATNEFKKGLKVEMDGVPFQIVDFQHVNPGKGRSFTRTKLKNMITGAVIERSITSGDKLEQADCMEYEMQYLFKDSNGYTFMNQETYEQVAIPEETLGETRNYLIENLVIKVLFFNDRIIGTEPPTFVNLKVIETEPSFRGDTVTGGSKPAKMESGVMVQVPFHIKEGDVLKIDSREGVYVEKVNK